MVLEPDARHHIADREQEIIFVILLRAEQADGLGDEVAVRGDLFVGRREFRGAVGEDVEADAVGELLLPEMRAGEHRAVDERVIADRVVR